MELENISDLRPLYKTLDEAANVMETFIGLSKGSEAPPLSLVEEAEDSLRELAH